MFDGVGGCRSLQESCQKPRLSPRAENKPPYGNTNGQPKPCKKGYITWQFDPICKSLVMGQKVSKIKELRMSKGGFRLNGGRPRVSDEHRAATLKLMHKRETLRFWQKRLAAGRALFDRTMAECVPIKVSTQGLRDALAEVNKQIALHRAHALLTNHVPEPPKMPELPPVTVPEAPFDWTQALPVPEALQPLANPPKTATIPQTYIEEAYDANMSPLDFMLKVMRDPKADPLRRDRMAMAAAPFIHLKAAEAKIGKREDAKRKAAEVGAGGSKFSAPAAPRLVANSR